MKILKFLKKLSLLIIVAAFCTTYFFTNISFAHSHISALAATKRSEEQYEEDQRTGKVTVEVMSYLNVFENYYGIATAQLLNDNIEMPFTFVQFCEGYYSHEYDIALYTDYVIDYVISYEAQYQDTNNDITAYELFSDVSSGDADYILKTTVDYDITPNSAFARQPIYDGYNGQSFDYSTIQIGDIVHESDTILANSGHTAIISDVEHASYYGNYVQTIEAVGSGVSYGMLDDNRMVSYGVMILRVVDATEEQRRLAVSFMKAQIGKPYSLNPLRLNKSISSTEWYCSELVYAAYNYVGIDVGVRKDDIGVDNTMLLGCLPWDIYYSYNTYDKCMQGAKYIDAQLVYSLFRWSVRVFNNTGSGRTIYYNKKMCFESAAKDWKGLNNIASIYVASGGYTTIAITENWFATDIAISIIVGGKRYVTYAHNLDDDPYTMSVFYN